MTYHPTTHRRRVTAAAALVLFAGVAGAASADPGSPGSTFPEQPTNLVSGCNAILTNPNNAFTNRAEPARAIVEGLTIDACFGGP